jgi:pimeloyl-ACP methyl ester carboxylesterase
VAGVVQGPRLRWESGYVAGKDVRLYVRRVVEPVAAPVLLLHGLGVSGSVWQPFARRLLPELAAVVPDLRGHGQSDAPPSGYSLADYAADLAELITSALSSPSESSSTSPSTSATSTTPKQPNTPRGGASASGVPVVGHSLGALVGMQLAASRPELVQWLVLLDPPLDPSVRNTEVDAVYRLRHAPAGELEGYLLERNPGGGELLANALAREFRQAADAAFEELAAARPFRALRVAAPTLLVQADPARGGVLGDAAAAAAVARLGNARLLKIEGAPHAVHASHAAELVTAIRRFAGYPPAN